MNDEKSRLRLALDHLKHTPGLKRDSAAIAGAMALALAVGGFVLAHQRFHVPWSSDYALTADFTAVPGVASGQGQEVRIAGVPVGEITGAKVSDKGLARLTLRFKSNYHIYDNAQMVLRPKSPLNEMYVEINPGGPPGRILKAGSNVSSGHTAEPVEADEVLQNLDDRTRAALGSLLAESDAALSSADATVPADLRQAAVTLNDLKPVVDALAQRRVLLSSLVHALATISRVAGRDDTRTASLVTGAQQTLAVLNARGADLDATLKRLPGVTSQLRNTTSSVTALTAQLDPTLADIRHASTDLPKALDKLRGVVSRLGEVVPLARPVVAAARPVVADLRPLVSRADLALQSLRPLTMRADVATAQLVRYLPSLKDFVYNTASVLSLEDANGAILRGLLEVSPTTLPVKLPLSSTNTGSRP
jgi:phospholipid/cholesterol/gamma-HCH transport system substrate-binding protein